VRIFCPSFGRTLVWEVYNQRFLLFVLGSDCLPRDLCLFFPDRPRRSGFRYRVITLLSPPLVHTLISLSSAVNDAGRSNLRGEKSGSAGTGPHN
jgi:hypothetical protein